MLLETSIGRWALLFVQGAGSPGESAVEWFTASASAFPEMRFAIITREADGFGQAATSDTGELVDVVADPGWLLAESLGYGTHPACVASVDGVYVRELMWPFTEAQMIRALAEAVHVEIVLPDPSVLVGTRAPDFLFTDESGATSLLSALPLPILLVFINLGCHPCLVALPSGADIPSALSVVLVVAAASEPATNMQQDDLAALRESLGPERTTVALVSRETLVAYSVVRSPTLALLDSAGSIVWVEQRATDREALTAALQAQLMRMLAPGEP